MPIRKKLLPTNLRREVEERLWNKNGLDKLVWQKLGSWQEGEPEKLTEQEIKEIEKKILELKDFIAKLENLTIYKGELERNLIKEEGRSLEEWIKENNF